MWKYDLTLVSHTKLKGNSLLFLELVKLSSHLGSEFVQGEFLIMFPLHIQTGREGDASQKKNEVCVYISSILHNPSYHLIQQ